MRRLVLAVALFAASAQAQWTLQESHSTASLRGIHSLSPDIAWASGTRGTVLRTTDGGQTWQTCTIPPNAERLDFRGIQALDANTAIIMSSGKGDASRVFRTTDACKTWKLVFSDPDETGFFDAICFTGPDFGVLIGDPVGAHFPVFTTTNAGDTWQSLSPNPFAAAGNQSLFAASNTSLLIAGKSQLFVVTGGGVTSLLTADTNTHLDLATGEAAGAFSIASRDIGANHIFVVVGGDYKQPDQTTGTAIYTTPDGKWHTAESQPHGYRSAVAYHASTKSWIAVGINGTDISKDDGRHWTPLTGSNDRNWNALSLPFVVGPNGRIGKLTR